MRVLSSPLWSAHSCERARIVNPQALGLEPFPSSVRELERNRAGVIVSSDELVTVLERIESLDARAPTGEDEAA